jgi:hypothetical protein
VYSEWDSETDQYYWGKLNLEVIPFDTKHLGARDQMAFEMVENGDQLARDTLLRIIRRDKDPAKISRAQSLINSIDSSDVDNRYL